MTAASRSGRMPGYREYQLLRLIRAFLIEHGRAPTYTAISRELGMARHHAADTVRRLENRGLVRRVGEGRVRRIAWVAGEDR